VSAAETRPGAPPRPLRHDELVARLWRAAGAGTLPHALLFHGPAGIGKFAAARWFAAGLLCAGRRQVESGEGPCGVCGPCKRFAAGSHRDVFVLDPVAEDEEHIKIARLVRRPDEEESGPNVRDFLSLKAAEGPWRIVIVREMERIRHSSDEAQNALLKMLEEPGAGVLWVLETSRPEALLETVLSRCTRLAFEPLTRAEVEAVLAAHGLHGPYAQALARASGGSPGRALALHEAGALELLEKIAATLAGGEAPLAAARAAWQAEGRHAGRTVAARARARARALVDLALEVALDLGRAAAGLDPDALAHGELARELARAGALPGPAGMRRLAERLLEVRADLELNLDPQTALERAFLALGDSAPRSLRRAVADAAAGAPRGRGMAAR